MTEYKEQKIVLTNLPGDWGSYLAKLMPQLFIPGLRPKLKKEVVGTDGNLEQLLVKFNLWDERTLSMVMPIPMTTETRSRGTRMQSIHCLCGNRKDPSPVSQDMVTELRQNSMKLNWLLLLTVPLLSYEMWPNQTTLQHPNLDQQLLATKVEVNGISTEALIISDHHFSRLCHDSDG